MPETKTTLHQDMDDVLAAYKEAGADRVGILQLKDEAHMLKETKTTKQLSTEEFKELMGKEWDNMLLHIKPKPKCDHEWNNEGINPEYCLKCGMSLMAHAMMECP
jgi:hypothetical protein